MNKAFKRYPKKAWSKVEPKRYKTKRAWRMMQCAMFSAQAYIQIRAIQSTVAKTPQERLRKATAIAQIVVQDAINKTKAFRI